MKTIPFKRTSLVAVLFLILQSHAWAHAFLDHADPKVGSTIIGSPAEVKTWFTQELEPAFSSLQVMDAQGREVDKKDMHLDEKDKKLMIVSLPPLPAGTYTVNWQAVSVDTHHTQGYFEFTVK
ncbi:MAG TPA: copper resistance protein CopC [Verrucomicrobiae bacterium]